VGDTTATPIAQPVTADRMIVVPARPAAFAGSSLDRLASRPVRLLALAVIYAIVVLAFPKPDGVSAEGWRITALFLATIAGLMIQPLPGAALVIISLTLFVLIGGLPATRVLAGFASPSVWLVLAAMLMSRALRDTGLSRRIALVFVRLFGRTSLGVSYSLVMSDVTLAAGIPSITARSGGIVLPVARSIAELYDSTPGPTAQRLGTFLMTALYQGSAVACAMFMTGQASNVLVAGLAGKLAGVTVTWSSWFIAGLLPGLVSCAVIPYVVLKMLPPQIKRTPAAASFARQQLSDMGPLSRDEGIALAVFVTVCALWMTSGWHGLDVAVVAMAALGVLFVTNVLSWETALKEQSAWDVFVWYGGLLTMGEVLNETGSTTAFANWVGSSFTGMDWFVVLLLTLGIYFYAHYAFASITAHALAMFPPFVVMLIGLGTPPLLAVYSLACIANLTAGLTHYGTTTAPIVFAEKYVSFGDWWRVGFVASIVNLAIWLTVGFVWWKLLGFW
jgi:DASS family divalent anion:Na+ symporter